MKKFLLSFFVIFTFAFYSVYQKLNPAFLTNLFSEREGDGEENRVVAPAVVSSTPTPASTPTPVVTPKPVPTPKPAPTPVVVTPQGKYKNGEYVGDVADAYYGNVQVKVVIQGGKLVDVIFLDYPQHSDTSRSINSQAMPWLKEEAIQAQSAQVNTISGASATSGAFIQSLGSALVMAKN